MFKFTTSKSILKLSSIIVLALLAIFFFGKRSEEEKVESGKEGFTQLLYSRIRPQTRNARLFYEDALEKALKHIDRIRYNLGIR